MKKIIAIWLLIGIMLGLCGCDVNYESESRYIVSFIGFDGGSEVKVCVEAVTGSGSSETKSTPYVFSSTGKTPEQAVYNLGAKLSKPLLFDHCAVVAVGNTLDALQLEKVLSFCRDEQSLNLAVYIVSTQNSAKLLESEETVMPAAGYDIMGLIEHNEKQTGVIFGNRFYEIEAKNSRKNPFFSLPFLKTENSGVYIAGERFYRDFECVLTLSQEESRVYSLLCNSNSGGKIEIDGNIARVKASKTSFKLNHQDEKTGINLKIGLKGEVGSDFCKALIAASERLISNAKLSGAGDIFGFADNIFRRDIELWRNIDQNYETFFENCQINISADEGGNIGA